jgi:serine/threonine protein kinase
MIIDFYYMLRGMVMLQVGQCLNDYKIISFLASGGMGEIYLAEEVALSRQVVIKVVRPEAIKYPNSEEG